MRCPGCKNEEHSRSVEPERCPGSNDRVARLRKQLSINNEELLTPKVFCVRRDLEISRSESGLISRKLAQWPWVRVSGTRPPAYMTHTAMPQQPYQQIEDRSRSNHQLASGPLAHRASITPKSPLLAMRFYNEELPGREEDQRFEHRCLRRRGEERGALCTTQLSACRDPNRRRSRRSRPWAACV